MLVPTDLRKDESHVIVSNSILEMIIKLLKRILQQLWRAGTQQMIDLVVRQAPTKQALYLCVVHLAQRLAHIFESSNISLFLFLSF